MRRGYSKTPRLLIQECHHWYTRYSNSAKRPLILHARADLSWQKRIDLGSTSSPASSPEAAARIRTGSLTAAPTVWAWSARTGRLGGESSFRTCSTSPACVPGELVL